MRALMLAAWRIQRRFGWRGPALFTLTFAIVGAMRDRAVAYFTETIAVAPGMLPFVSSAITWGIGLALGQGAMRVIAGPATGDRLARNR
jgi:hypothetical protein